MAHKTVTSNRIDVLRKQKEMTQEELANCLGVKQASISRKLAGVIPFSVQEVKACVSIFHTSADYLYGLSDIPDERSDMNPRETGPEYE
ncbi:helix-turn-helix transcriptional regulator [Bifidobacterium saguini]|nr:helix-turn-helix transcriptional regulator [Bifidobacterium saguini]